MSFKIEISYREQLQLPVHPQLLRQRQLRPKRHRSVLVVLLPPASLVSSSSCLVMPVLMSLATKLMTTCTRLAMLLWREVAVPSVDPWRYQVALALPVRRLLRLLVVSRAVQTLVLPLTCANSETPLTTTLRYLLFPILPWLMALPVLFSLISLLSSLCLSSPLL